MTNLFGDSAGFRLARLEIYNWGTFDGQIWVMAPDGQTGVLTGANGSGKSTVVDALLTLLVEGRQRNYNLASGAGSSRERSERTYVRGQYSRSRGDSAIDAKANNLRGSDTHTVLLGVFHDFENDKTVTLAQTLWISNSDRVDKHYYVASTDLNIEQHFPQRHIKTSDLPQGAQRYSTFSTYIVAARKALGLGGRPKALDLFNQTVAVKDIASLNEFVREHMLDKGDPEAKVDGLRDQYRELNEAHASIRRAGQQVNILTPLIDSAKDYRDYDERIIRYDAAKDLVPFYVADKAKQLLSDITRQTTSQRTAQESRLETVTQELASLRRDLQDIEIAIAQDSVGQRKRELEGKIQPLQREINALQVQAERYDRYAVALGLPAYNDEEDFYQNRTHAEALQDDLNAIINMHNQRRDEALLERQILVEQAKELDKEIQYLRANLSNIPEKVARVRQNIADKLGINIDDLPFIGELLKVRNEDSQWEGAIERLLHSFAQELIVPHDLYPRVSQYVNETNLGWRLVYRPVDPHRKSSRLPDKRDTKVQGMMAYDKVQIRPENNPYQDWLAFGLMKRFDYVCCSDMNDFRRAERAMTQQGQIKHNSSRHEKDDRRDLNNRRNYVLGWDNRDKLRQLETELDDISRQLAKLNDEITRIERELQQAREDVGAIKNLLTIQQFSEIDWRSRQVELDRLQQQLAELQAQAQQLQNLEKQRDEIRMRITDTEQRRDDINRKITTFTNQIERYKRELSKAEAQLRKATDEDYRIWELVRDIIEDTDKVELTIEDLSTRVNELENSLQRSINRFRGFQNNHQATILDAMNRFRREYPDEGVSLTASIESLADFERIHHQLQTDDLPKYEERFKQMLDRTVQRGVQAFTASLTEQERDIDRSIEELNDSLAQVDYGGGSHIRLIAEPSRDAEINDFRQALRACIPNVGDNSPEELERAFSHIKALIERFDSDTNWMRRVIDVRRWRMFAAEQIAPDGTQVDYYSDSSGKSGGQKAKLAYTILGSAIAHQYGLQDTTLTDKSFRFVVIDEAFSKLDDDNARFAMQLFNQLGMQLLVVTPMQQLHIIEDYVHAYHVVVNNDTGNDSRLFNLTRAEYRKQRRQFQAQEETA